MHRCGLCSVEPDRFPLYPVIHGPAKPKEQAQLSIIKDCRGNVEVDPLAEIERFLSWGNQVIEAPFPSLRDRPQGNGGWCLAFRGRARAQLLLAPRQPGACGGPYCDGYAASGIAGTMPISGLCRPEIKPRCWTRLLTELLSIRMNIGRGIVLPGSQAFQEGQQSIPWFKEPRPLVTLCCFCQEFFLYRQIGIEIDLGGLDGLMPQPQRDHRAINSRLQ